MAPYVPARRPLIQADIGREGVRGCDRLRLNFGLHIFWELLATFGASSGNGYPDVFGGGQLHFTPWDAPTPQGTTVRDTTTGATATYVAHATHVAGRGPAQPAALLHVDGHHFTVDAGHFARHFVAVVP